MTENNPPQDQITTLKALQQNELEIGKLYESYSKRFPEMESFWNQLVSDEKSHAFWISNLLKKVEGGQVKIDENRFWKDPINSFLAYVQELQNKEKGGEIAPSIAISNAVDIEKALIEQKYFEVYETDDPEVSLLLNDLNRATQTHLKLVENALEKHIKQ